MRAAPRPLAQAQLDAELAPRHATARRAPARRESDGRGATPSTPSIATSMRSGSSGTPAVPAAHTKRPQFGSPPANAALHSVESAIARATRCASRVASRARHDHLDQARRALAVEHDEPRELLEDARSSARDEARGSRPTAIATGALPAAPLASSSTVSLVLMSPSTRDRVERARDRVRAARARAARRSRRASVQDEDEQGRHVRRDHAGALAQRRDRDRRGRRGGRAARRSSGRRRSS